MIYRSHFPYQTPAGCQDEPFEYYFDLTVQPGDTPALLLGPLDKDAEFRWRGVRINCYDADPTQEVAVQFRDPFGEQLSDDLINIKIYATGPFDGGGGMAVPFDTEVVCPPGSVIESNWSVQA
jgi:hypothetical protein